MKHPINKTHKLLSITALFLTAFILMSGILYLFSSKLSDSQIELGRERLREVTRQNVAFVEQIVKDKVSFIESAAKSASELEDLKSKETTHWLDNLCYGTSFARLAIDFLNGESYTSDGYIVDINAFDYIDDIKKGETFLTDIIMAVIDGKPCVSIISPIIKNDAIVGAVRGTVYTQNFGDMLNIDFFQGEGYFHLINGKGEYLAVTDNDNAILMGENYFDAIEKLEYDKGYSAQKIKNDTLNGVRGTTAYSYENESRYAEYMPVGINDWYLVIMVPKQVIDKNSDAIRNDVILLMTALALISLAILLYFIYTMRRSLLEIKKVNEKLALGEERYRFMLERSDNVIFEYTLESGEISYSERFVSFFGYVPKKVEPPGGIIESKGIHPEDADSVISLFEDIIAGKATSSCEARVKNAAGQYLWCSIVVVTIFNDDHAPTKVFGVIENIDDKKKKEINLMIKAEKDQLTDLYNKAATERYIRDYLSESSAAAGMHALMIIDIDDFKLVNDRFGHLYGDIVLVRLAEKLKALFRSNDIIGRIGGDEFFVFMNNVNSHQVVVSKAKEICERFYNVYSENDVTCQISASVGVAIIPADTEMEFEELYRHADTALYATKASGKNNYSFYDGQSFGGYQSNRTEIDMAGTLRQKNFAANRSEYIFKVLYSADNVLIAVHSVLEFIADHFNVSRGYIFETSYDLRTTSNTFEWCADGIEPQIDKLQNLPIEVIHDAEEAFKKNGMYVIKSLDDVKEIERSVLEPQGIKSMLQFGMIDHGNIFGIIGFDYCLSERVPTDIEIDELSTISSILTTFIFKHREIERAKCNYISMSAIMNTFNSYAYIVDKESYKILFLNDKLAAEMPDIKVGDICFCAFQELDKPCEDCHFKGINELGNVRCVSERFVKRFGRNMTIAASYISWSCGETACLIVLT